MLKAGVESIRDHATPPIPMRSPIPSTRGRRNEDGISRCPKSVNHEPWTVNQPYAITPPAQNQLHDRCGEVNGFIVAVNHEP